MRQKRATLPASARHDSSHHAARHLVRLIDQLGTRKLALYAARPDELGTLEAATQLAEHGVTLCYPRVAAKTRTLSFFHVTDPTTLEPGSFGIAEPDAAAKPVPLDSIELFVVPGLAFDRTGGRLGWGKGHYDATLAHARGTRVGFCFDWQIVDQVPRAPHDVLMQLLVTSTGVMEIKNTSTSGPGTDQKQPILAT